MIKSEPAPLKAILISPAPKAPPIEPPTAESVTPALLPVAWMLAVKAVGVKVNEVSVIEPRVVITLTAVLAVVQPVTRALEPKVMLRVAETKSVPSSELTVELMAISVVVPLAEIDTAPVVVVVTGPLIVMVAALAEAARVIFFAVVVTDETMRLPVAAV